MNKLSQYAEHQRQQYDERSGTLDGAKAMVAGDYEAMRAHSSSTVRLMLSLYWLRRFGPDETAKPERLKLLDFGCGPGRVMEIVREAGAGQVDGCDISQEMLKHAAANPALNGSRFFLSNGPDAGDAPAGHYDIAYSFLCLHHIPMRQTRIKILEDLARTLANGGMIFAQFNIFPGITAAKIPVRHAHWTENMVAQKTNAQHDVFITPDALGLVYEDFRLFFKRVAIIEGETRGNFRNFDHYHCDPNFVYNFGFNEIYIAGFKP